MGAENSVLEDCEWDGSTTDGLWSLRHGTLADSTEISCFTVAKKDRRHEELLRKLIKNLKSVRHPSVLTYVCSEEESSGPQLITEKAVPLESLLPSLSCSEICAGLHTVLDALHFLHENVGASHNNVHIGSVYVTSDGSWRLGGLEHMCKFSEAASSFLESVKAYRHETTITPEEKEGKVSTDPSVGHARDVYAFAVLAESLLEHMEDLGDLRKTFELRIQDECLHADPRKRPKVHSLMCDRLFNTDFLEIALFLKSITLKTEEERSHFFKNLLPRLQKQHEDLVARRLVPGLLSRFVFLDQTAVENVLPSLLTPKQNESPPYEFPSGSVQPLLSETLYKQYVVPKLVKIFSVHDYHIHILLLQYFPYYVHLIDKDDLEFDVFPQVLLGLRDNSEMIVSLSLHALAEMVPVLGRDVVIGGKSKKYFREGLPKSCNHDVLSVINNKQSCVQGIIGKMKLVDLAKQSEKNIPDIVKADDADLRWKEKEQKREEMRMRREEMKRKREEAKLARQKSKELHEINPSTDPLPELSEIYQDDYDSRDSNIAPVMSETKEGPVEDDTENWSAWSEGEAETDYCEEIEQELQDMNVEAGPPVILSNFQDDSTTSSIQQDDLEITIVHQNDAIKPSYSKGSALRLVTNKKSDKQKSQSIDNNLEISKSEKPAVMNLARHLPTSKQQKLGSEFDIMDLDIKVSKIPDVDFFADMTPMIEKKSGAGNLTTSDTPSGNNSSKMVQKKFAMKVQETEIVDSNAGGGWGEDDW